MIATLMLRALVGATLIGLAAICADGVARQFGWRRRWIWAAALAASLTLPLMSGWLPSPGMLERLGLGATTETLSLDGLSIVLDAAPGAAAAGAAADAAKGRTDEVLLVLWAAGSAVLLSLLLWSAGRLRSARRGGLPARVAGVPAVVAGRWGPAVVGVLRPSVLLPAWIRDLSSSERRLIVAHEWEHVRARDTLLLALAAASLVAAPWNLALWWQHRRLRDAIETDCDARLLARGVDRRDYGLVLLHTAGRTRGFPLLSPSLAHTRSTLERRILAMTYRAPKHRIARSGGLIALAALVLAAACDLASNRPTSSPTDPVVPDLSLTEEAEATAATAEAGTYGFIQAADPRRMVVVEGVDGEPGEARFRITTPDDEVRSGNVVIRSRQLTLSGTGGEPIYVIDGVRVDELDLEPLEIHSIEVLKGGAARAIWGEEGVNGVVQITTKAAAEAAGLTSEAVRLTPLRVREQG